MTSFFLKKIGLFFIFIQLFGCGELLLDRSEMSTEGCATGDENLNSEYESLEQHLFQQINSLREAEGLATYTWNEDLARSARYHAQDMAIDNYFEVDTYDRNNGVLEIQCSLSERIIRFDQNAKGENIARDLENTIDVVQEWLNEKGYRENLLSPVYQTVGIGYYTITLQSKEFTYWVMDVGTR